MSMIPKQTLLAIERQFSSMGANEPATLTAGQILALARTGLLFHEACDANRDLGDELDRLRRESCPRRCGGMG
ncbi:hypothetical protein [Pseudoroseomonas cervicalis]|uniref:hypothetical protein n=1 Tax=Teichococcus cervicalis TaxID=204525 RepID=UPI002785B36A|nr:hypothetical protein [Pseudoroseomonas cervicalis]MDQ1077965.1 hypothetical protein [Pseudoroseomonas cervicalis]